MKVVNGFEVNEGPLTNGQIDFLLNLVSEYRADVTSGTITGFGQSQKEELDDMAVLMDNLRLMYV